MKKSRHTEEKVIAAVKQMEGGRKTGVNPKTATRSQGTKYIEWSEEWIWPDQFTVAI
jgi:hypothetical protein